MTLGVRREFGLEKISPPPKKKEMKRQRMRWRSILFYIKPYPVTLQSPPPPLLFSSRNLNMVMLVFLWQADESWSYFEEIFMHGVHNDTSI